MINGDSPVIGRLDPLRKAQHACDGSERTESSVDTSPFQPNKGLTDGSLGITTLSTARKLIIKYVKS